MPSIAETSAAPGNLAASLAAGVDSISQNQTVTFTKYRRVVLPLDGFLFWVRADLSLATTTSDNLGPFINAANYSEVSPDPSILLTAKGSLHFSSDAQQDEDGSPTINSVVFTTTEEILDLAAVDGATMWIGTFDGIRFAFNSHGSYYRQANLFHYRGRAVFSVMESQIIDNAQQLNSKAFIVSNSLPIWLAMNAGVQVYPSFAVPSNSPPPYATAHIEPSGTKALQEYPTVLTDGSFWQLAVDRVRFTLYGLDNNQAQDFAKYVLDGSLSDSSAYGVMSMPIIVDEKRTQTELQILAQKKTFTLDVSYYQARMQSIAMQLILSAVVAITPSY